MYNFVRSNQIDFMWLKRKAVEETVTEHEVLLKGPVCWLLPYCIIIILLLPCFLLLFDIHLYNSLSLAFDFILLLNQQWWT